MLNKSVMPVLVGALALTAGCLQKETSHTLYLSPDGAVSWVTSEANVHSDEGDVSKRIVEEQRYLAPALLGTHDVARAFADLGPQGSVRTTVLRDGRPFHVVTEARFEGIDRVLARLFTEVGVTNTASLVRNGDQATLRVRLDFAKGIQDDETPVVELLDLDHFRFVLTEGRFGEVTGFDVSDDTSAKFSTEWLERADKAYQANGTIEFALSWTAER